MHINQNSYKFLNVRKIFPDFARLSQEFLREKWSYGRFFLKSMAEEADQEQVNRSGGNGKDFAEVGVHGMIFSIGTVCKLVRIVVRTPLLKQIDTR